MFENKESSTQNLNTNQNSTISANQNKNKDIDIHVMPGKFLPQVPQTKGSAKKKISFVVVLLVFFLIALIGGGIWVIMNQETLFGGGEPVVNDKPNVNDNTNTNVNTNTNTNVNDNTNTNVNTNTNTNVNDNTNTSLPDTSALDTDNDGLTHEEELVFGTDFEDDDTDKDGFSDGQEIGNLYNPLAPRQSLRDSGLVSPYINSTYDYSILIPSSWLAKAIASNNSDVTILPDSEVGDSFLIQVEENTEGWTLSEWKANQYSEAIFENFTLGGQPAFLTTNGLFLLMATADYRYTIQYRISDTDNIYYPAIFEMMLNSFSLEKTPNTIIDE